MADERRIGHVSNPRNPFRDHEVVWDEVPPPALAYTVMDDTTKSILSHNDSPDIPFRWSVNPYRGCYHGCSYCYARPTHHYLDLGAGTDFERTIVVKREASRLLAEAFDKSSWAGELVVFSGVTDCYQPIESSLRLTRQCLEVCAAYRNPVSIITKSALICRDVEVLAELSRSAFCHVTVSIPFYDADTARAVEPYAPAPSRRFAAIRALSEAGISVSVNVAPIIPGLNDSDIPDILKEAREAGASSVGYILVRLPGAVGEVFEERTRKAFPERAERILHQIEQCRGGKRNESRFGHRHHGEGPRWAAIESLLQTWAKKLGYVPARQAPVVSPFRRPDRSGQLSLF